MTKAEQLALARLKHLYDETVDTAFYLDRSSNKILQDASYSIKLFSQAIHQIHREAQRQQQKHEQNQH